MDHERSQSNPEQQFEQLRADFDAVNSRYMEMMDAMKLTKTYVGGPSHFDNVARNLLTVLSVSLDYVRDGIEPGITLDQFKDRLQALNDYFDMLDRDPDFFKGESTAEGAHPELTKQSDKINLEGCDLNFSPQIYYVQEARKRRENP